MLFIHQSKSESSLPLDWMDPVGCNFGRPVYPVGPVSSSILCPSVGQCTPKSNENISAPPPLECINYASNQTVSPAIPTWFSYLRTKHIAHQRKVCVRGRTSSKTQLACLAVTVPSHHGETGFLARLCQSLPANLSQQVSQAWLQEARAVCRPLAVESCWHDFVGSGKLDTSIP